MPQTIYKYIKGNGALIRNILEFIRNFLFVGSYIHLWYFVGLIIATLLLYLFVKKLKLNNRYIIVIVLILYTIGTVMNAYIYSLKEIINVPVSGFKMLDKRYLLLWLYFKVFTTTRNGLFFGFPYLFFGYLIAKNNEKICRKNYFLLSVISFVIMTGETFIVHEVFGRYGQDMLFTLLPTSIFVFLFILFIDCKNYQINAEIVKHLRNLSVLYFGLHMFINFYLVKILYKGFDIVLHSMVRFIVVIILNYIAAEMIIRLSNIRYFKWLKKFY